MSLVLVFGDHVPYGDGSLSGCGMLLLLMLVTAACTMQRYCRRWEDRGMVSLALLAFALLCFHDACVVGHQRCRYWRGGLIPSVHGVGGCVRLV